MRDAAGDARRSVRVPTQVRARRTVEAILAAAAQLLIDGGLEAANTNAVARLAGVNVATVYAYFPDKIAIVRTLAERFEDERTEYIDSVVDHIGDVDWREWVAIAIDRLVQFRIDVPAGAALRKVVTTTPELRPLDERSTATTGRAFAGAMVRRGVELDADHAMLVATLIARIVTDTVDRACAATPPDERLLAELKKLVVRYLSPYVHG